MTSVCGGGIPCLSTGWANVILLIIALIAFGVGFVSPPLAAVGYAVGGVAVFIWWFSDFFRDCRYNWFGNSTTGYYDDIGKAAFKTAQAKADMTTPQ